MSTAVLVLGACLVGLTQAEAGEWNGACYGWDHPRVNSGLVSGTFETENDHELVNSLMSPWLGTSHPDIDSIIRSGTVSDYPSWHPNLDDICDVGLPALNFYAGHPNIDDAIANNQAYPSSHPTVQGLLWQGLPSDHPDLDELLATMGTWDMPADHPIIDVWAGRVPETASAGAILGYHMGGIFVIAVLMRMSAGKLCGGSGPAPTELSELKQVKTQEEESKERNNDRGSAAEWVYSEADAAAPSDALKLHNQKAKQFESEEVPGRRSTEFYSRKSHREHKTKDPIYDYGKYSNSEEPALYSSTLRRRRRFTVERVFNNNLATERSSQEHANHNKLWHTRIGSTQWTSGDIIFVTAYLLLNIWSCILSDLIATRTLLSSGRAWGSLAAANMMFIIIPATRNSILTWVLGLPFDHVVLYHRALGRVGLVTVVVHGLMYLPWSSSSFEYTTGLAAGACGLCLGITSIDYFRRQFFNLFFYTHFLFVPMFVLGYMHVPGGRPFLMTAIVLYGLDRLLRALWTACPRRALVLTTKGDALAQLRIAKNPITQSLGLHKTGQYFFINFPGISLLEWHPYSVSSGPREQDIEFHIRALGDHTDAVVELAKKTKEGGEMPYIRFDGPYGHHDFNFRQYPKVLLAGGGVGVTPVMGMLKDVYNVGNYNEQEKKALQPHRIQHLFAMWCIRHKTDYDWFKKDLLECVEKAKRPEFPKLSVWVYVSRLGEGEEEEHLIKGRPNIKKVFDTVCAASGGKGSTLAFACGPAAMVNEIWDLSITRSDATTNIDFHHETFEF